MSEKIVQLNEEVFKGQTRELVRGSVEETLNEPLEAEAQKLTQTARYERYGECQGHRSGHHYRNLATTSDDVTLHIPKLKGVTFETAIIERHRRGESASGKRLSKCIWQAILYAVWRISRRLCGAARYQAILVAIAVNEDGYHEVLGAVEGMKAFCQATSKLPFHYTIIYSAIASN